MEERHEEETTRNVGLLIAGFALGAITGTILGLLFAPKSGKELREELKEKSGEYYGLAREKLKEAFDTGKEKLTETAEKVKEAVQTTVKGMKEKLAEKEKEEDTRED